MDSKKILTEIKGLFICLKYCYMLQVQEDILRAKSFLTVHKLTRNTLDIDAALEALETAYTSLENISVTAFHVDIEDEEVRELDDNQQNTKLQTQLERPFLPNSNDVQFSNTDLVT